MKKFLIMGLCLALVAFMPQAHADPPITKTAHENILKAPGLNAAEVSVTLAETFYAVERRVETVSVRLAPVQSCASEQRKGGREIGTALQRLSRGTA